MERMGGSKQSLGSIASISKKQGRWREGKTNKKQGEGGRKRKQVILERAGRKDIRERKDEVGSKVKKKGWNYGKKLILNLSFLFPTP